MKYFHKIREGSMNHLGFNLDWGSRLLYIRWHWKGILHEIRIRHYWAGWSFTTRQAAIGERYWDSASIDTPQGKIEIPRKR